MLTIITSMICFHKDHTERQCVDTLTLSHYTMACINSSTSLRVGLCNTINIVISPTKMPASDWLKSL